MVIRDYIGKQINEIDYIKCQYPGEPIITKDNGNKGFKIWLLSQNTAHPEEAYYYLNVITSESNIIKSIDKIKGEKGIEKKISKLPFAEDYLAKLRMETISIDPERQKDPFSALYGTKVDEIKLKRIWHINEHLKSKVTYEEYFFPNSDYWDNSELIATFGISPDVCERWKEKRIEFTLYFYVLDGRLAKVEIFKAKIGKDGKKYSKSAEPLFPTKQEETIASKIVRFFLDPQ